MELSEPVFSAFVAWVGLGAVLYAVAGVTGRVRHGTRGRIFAAVFAVVVAGFAALLLAFNLREGVYRVAVPLLVLGLIAPLNAVWDMAQARNAKLEEEKQQRRDQMAAELLGQEAGAGQSDG